MATITAAQRKARAAKANAVMAANMKMREKLASKHALTKTDFMPRNIAQTLSDHDIPIEGIPSALRPKEQKGQAKKKKGTSIPFSGIARHHPGSAKKKQATKKAEVKKVRLSDEAVSRILGILETLLSQ